VKRSLVLAVVAALCFWAFVAWVWRPLSCNQSISDMAGRTRGARETGDVYRMTLLARENLAALRRLEPRCGMTVNLYLLEADNEDLLGRKEAAIERLRYALTVDQRPELYFNIGTLMVELGRIDEAVDNYVMATRIMQSPELGIASPEAERRVKMRLEQLRARRK